MGKSTAQVIAASSVAAFASVALFAATASANPLPHQDRPTAADTASAPGAVFVQSNDVKGNTIVVYDRAADGSLTKAGSYATGGLGGQEAGTGPDHLSSQGSLTYDSAQHRLYAVNADSNTLTVFTVSGDRLAREQVVSTGGSFPVSVTAHDGNVYVLNALAGGSVQGYVTLEGHLVRVPSWNRSLGIQGGGTPGQVSFTPDGSQLVVAGKENNTLSVYEVGPLGNISAKPTDTQFASGGQPFALTFDTNGRAVVADVNANSLDTFTVGRSGSLTKIDEAATGQKATCWVARDGNFFYASNTGSSTISAFEQKDGKLEKISDTPTGAAPVDLTVSSDGEFLYVQTGTTGGVDEFAVSSDGSLTKIGSVQNVIGSEGITAS